MNHSTDVIVFGASGHAKVVMSTLQEAGYRVIAVYDDDSTKWGKKILGVSIVGKIEDPGHPASAVIGVGDNVSRKQIATRVRSVDWITVIHPKAVVDPSVVVGPGTVVFAGSVIQPDTRIGNHCIVNTSASIDHDCTIEDFVHVCPGVHLAGGVKVGEGTLLGIGSCAIPCVEIGKWSTIGAGAAVVGPVPDEVTVAGVPARVLVRKSPG